MSTHNPDNLTPEQIGTADGWRLLDEDEIGDVIKRGRQVAVHSGLEIWTSKGWTMAIFGNEHECTYRFCGSRAELRAARNLPPEQPTVAEPQGARVIKAGGLTLDLAPMNIASSFGLLDGLDPVVESKHLQCIFNIARALQAERAKVEELTRERDQFKRTIEIGIHDHSCQREEWRAERDTLRQQLEEARAELAEEKRAYADADANYDRVVMDKIQLRADLEAAKRERDGAFEAVEKLKEIHASYIRRIRDMLGMKTPGDGFVEFLQALKAERDKLTADLAAQSALGEKLKTALEGWQHVWTETDCEWDDCSPAAVFADTVLAEYELTHARISGEVQG